MRKPCCDKQYTNKGAWSKQEDQKLVDYIQKHGQGCWSTLPQAAGLLRCGKSCRMRWINYLRPDLKRGRFEEDEEDLIIKLHALLGNRWSLIAGRLPGRTSNEVKNYWNSYLMRKLENKGIDPNNHRLGNDFLRSRDSQKYAGETLSGLRSNTEPEIGKHQVDNESKSDAGSCMEKGPSCLPDLNLDITLSNQSHSIATDEGTQESTHESFTSRELELVYSPTLLLFK